MYVKNYNLMGYFLMHGIDANHRNYQGKTCLDIAKIEKIPYTINLLKKYTN